MRYYLSSFKLGKKADLLVSLYGHDLPVGYIANALDHVGDKKWLDEWIAKDMNDLRSAGLRVQRLDLRDYFGADGRIAAAAEGLSGVWLSGGNVFVLRQAMKLSGFDGYILGDQIPDTFVYGGYSAGCCVLSPSLRPYAIVDDPRARPYPQTTETLWDGLGVLDFAFMPHFESDHSESLLVEREIQFCIENNTPYRAFRDGEVLVI